MVTTTFAFLVFVLGFGFLIFIHELGHFLVAKWVGIRCTQFAIGFGPAIVAWRKGIGFRLGTTEEAYSQRIREHLGTPKGPADKEVIQYEEFTTVEQREPGAPSTRDEEQAAKELGLGETEYRLNYLPLGGYVKMLGQEDLDPAARSSDPRAFGNKSVGARFAVISAGVIMNMITGILFFLVAFMVGVSFPPPVVGPIAPGSPAATAEALGHGDDPAYRGLRVGDRVLAVDGTEPIDYTDVRVAAALSAKGEPVELTIQRDGEPAPIVYRLTADEGGMDLLDFGFEQPLSLDAVIVIREMEAYAAGVRPGMKVVAADGEAVSSYADLHQRVAAAKGRPVTLTLEATDEAFEKIREQEALAADAEGVEAAALQARVEVPIRALPPSLTGAQGVPVSVAGFYPPVRLVPIPDGPAAEAGIEEGDLLRELGGVVWPRLEEITSIIEQAGDRPIDVTVLRDGVPVSLGAIQPRRGRLGIALSPAIDSNLVAGVIDGSPAASLEGFVPGSRLLRAAGEEVGDWRDLYRVLSLLEVEGDAATAAVEYQTPLSGDAPGTGELRLPAAEVAAMAEAQWVVELRTIGVVLEWDRVMIAADDPWGAMALGLRKTRSFMGQAYIMILRLFQGTVPANQLSGPVGITAVGTQVAGQSWSYLFYFLGLLSVNLAVINFLPIPIADGGHAVFLAIEKLKGSPVSPKVQVAAMYVGLVLLGGIFLFVTYHDFLKLFGINA